MELRVVGPCARCGMVELDPTSGARHGSVLRTLATYRRSNARIDFGVFCELAKRGELGERERSGKGLLYVEQGALIEPIVAARAEDGDRAARRLSEA